MTRTPHKRRLRMADYLLIAMVLTVVVTFAYAIDKAYRDHQAWCELPVRSIPNCGD